MPSVGCRACRVSGRQKYASPLPGAFPQFLTDYSQRFRAGYVLFGPGRGSRAKNSIRARKFYLAVSTTFPLNDIGLQQSLPPWKTLRQAVLSSFETQLFPIRSACDGAVGSPGTELEFAL